MKKILIVTTNVSEITPEIKTGVWLEEFAIPYLNFLEAGFDIIIASPNGGLSPVDPKSIDEKYQNYVAKLNDTKALEDREIQNTLFDCLFIPGGHGCMFDLPKNNILAKIIEQLKANRKVISTICHGACGLLSAKDNNHKPYVWGKALTAFTNAEEEMTGLAKYMPFPLESKLKELGANFISETPENGFVVEDNYLITGQNQFACEHLSEKVIHKLNRIHS
ncbi:MAG: type 1 glutamine amidotransferase domain-containing protein [Candidatus Gastranaerophilales bacterium]|nr:type 1 glutamine amidotransferase domain-containing protein [Candidatus Gastranaerophilales bacterium]